MMPCNLQMDLT